METCKIYIIIYKKKHQPILQTISQACWLNSAPVFQCLMAAILIVSIVQRGWTWKCCSFYCSLYCVCYITIEPCVILFLLPDRLWVLIRILFTVKMHIIQHYGYGLFNMTEKHALIHFWPLRVAQSNTGIFCKAVMVSMLANSCREQYTHAWWI